MKYFDDYLHISSALITDYLLHNLSCKCTDNLGPYFLCDIKKNSCINCVINLSTRMQSLCRHVHCLRRLWRPAQAHQLLKVTHMHRSARQLQHRKVQEVTVLQLQSVYFFWGKKHFFLISFLLLCFTFFFGLFTQSCSF